MCVIVTTNDPKIAPTIPSTLNPGSRKATPQNINALIRSEEKPNVRK